MRQPVHFRKVCPLGCGWLHDEQQMGGGDAVVGGAVVGLPSCSSSILRFLIAVSCPSFAAAREKGNEERGCKRQQRENDDDDHIIITTTPAQERRRQRQEGMHHKTIFYFDCCFSPSSSLLSSFSIVCILACAPLDSNALVGTLCCNIAPCGSPCIFERCVHWVVVCCTTNKKWE